MYSDKIINQMYYEKLNNLNARNRIQRDLKYAVSSLSDPEFNERNEIVFWNFWSR